MRDKRRPNVGVSYRCSLALADEAFSQNTDLLPGFDERDDLLSDMPNENTWKGIQLEQRFVVKTKKKKKKKKKNATKSTQVNPHYPPNNNNPPRLINPSQ